MWFMGMVFSGDMQRFPSLTFFLSKKAKISKNTGSWLSQVNLVKGGFDFSERGTIVKTNQPTNHDTKEQF